MNSIKFIYTFFLLFLVVNTSKAQQDAQYTQYMYNTTSVNAACIGSKGVFNAVLLHRTLFLL